MADLQAIKEQLDGLTLLEASELVKLLEESWGVSAAAPVAVAGGAAPAAAAEAAEEQTEFDVVLTEGGAKKINVIGYRDIAAKLGVGASTLRRRFAREGRSLRRIVREARMRLAREMLRAGNGTVTQADAAATRAKR